MGSKDFQRLLDDFPQFLTTSEDKLKIAKSHPGNSEDFPTLSEGLRTLKEILRGYLEDQRLCPVRTWSMYSPKL